jgi:hypothetical protein
MLRLNQHKNKLMPIKNVPLSVGWIIVELSLISNSILFFVYF